MLSEKVQIGYKESKQDIAHRFGQFLFDLELLAANWESSGKLEELQEMIDRAKRDA
jgi:hypothetical protein